MSNLVWRQTVRANDIGKVRDLVAATQVFSDEEVTVAAELVEEKLQQGDNCSYHFLFVDDGEKLIAYTCFGLIPFTDRRFDLYWIAVNPNNQQKKLGTELLVRTERLITERSGLHLYAETSSRDLYLPTRNFYCRTGFLKIAEINNFYRDGDHKVIYHKILT